MTESIDRAAIKAEWDAQNDCHDPEATVRAGDALLAALEEAERELRVSREYYEAELSAVRANRNEWASRMMELATTEQKLERAERRIAEVERLAKLDLKCPCCTGYIRILAALHPVAETTESEKTCPCAKCNPEAWWMILCPDCGNKRCPRASWHGFECTHNNESGQVGTPTTESEWNTVPLTYPHLASGQEGRR